MWDTIMLRKCQELTSYLLGNMKHFNLKASGPVLERSDTRVLRERILQLSASKSQKLGLNRMPSYATI